MCVRRPTVKHGMDCGMDSFRGLTGSEFDLMPKWPSTWTLPASTTQSQSRWSKLAVILKQPTISFWGLTAWVSCHRELLLPACGDRVLGWSDLDFSSNQIVPGRKVWAIHAIACWTSTTKSREPLWASRASLKLSRGLGTRPLHELKLSFEPRLSVLDIVWKLQGSTAGSRDLVVDVQQAMAC